MASSVLPRAATMNATTPPSSAKRSNERGVPDLTTTRFCQSFRLRPVTGPRFMTPVARLPMRIRRHGRGPTAAGRSGVRPPATPGGPGGSTRRSSRHRSRRGAKGGVRARLRSRSPGRWNAVPTVHAMAVSPSATVAWSTPIARPSARSRTAQFSQSSVPSGERRSSHRSNRARSASTSSGGSSPVKRPSAGSSSTGKRSSASSAVTGSMRRRSVESDIRSSEGRSGSTRRC